MDRIEIITVCGMGFGTSLMMFMDIESIAKRHGFEITGEATDVSSVSGRTPDLLVTSSELYNQLDSFEGNIVSINNMLDKEEIESKVMPYIEEYYN